MIHLVTLSGNSERFTQKGMRHKALCPINESPVIKHFIDLFPDFEDFETIFLCRNQDLETTNLKETILLYAKHARVFGIDKNSLGPVYSISKIFDKIPDKFPVLITYIDALQKASLHDIQTDFKDYEGGLTVHDFKNPHWRNNKNFCLVKHGDNLNTESILEKFDFSYFDFSQTNCAGSTGSYYFSSGSLMKDYFNKLINNRIFVNGEHYVTQALDEMIKDGLKVKSAYYPYVSLGVPEDLNDYEFWVKWFKKSQ
jgi:bifunctional N-acetylglucosamine-1-phosphate-uridyltransferase/glucosamine-1-phosphate-acetyltransferase GlmU-like protein